MPIYMNYEGIHGSVTVPGYGGWIELESVSLGDYRGTAVGRNSRAGGSANVSSLSVTRTQDATSPRLFREAMNGAGKKVTIAFCNSDKSGCVPYLKIELENTMISNYQIGGSHSDRPSESLSLNFTKITYVAGSESNLQNESVHSGYALGTR